MNSVPRQLALIVTFFGGYWLIVFGIKSLGIDVMMVSIAAAFTVPVFIMVMADFNSSEAWVKIVLFVPLLISSFMMSIFGSGIFIIAGPCLILSSDFRGLVCEMSAAITKAVNFKPEDVWYCEGD